jgi:hypothetical protein
LASFLVSVLLFFMLVRPSHAWDVPVIW